MRTGPATITLRLPRNATAAAQARECVQQVCADVPEPTLDDATLLVSEVVTNAVRHGSGIITVAVECDERSIGVAVADQGDGSLAQRPLSATASGGRGLHLVDRLAASWGCRTVSHGPGKVVWFRVGPPMR